MHYRIIKRTYRIITSFHVEYFFLFFWFRPKRIASENNRFATEQLALQKIIEDINPKDEEPQPIETIIKIGNVKDLIFL